MERRTVIFGERMDRVLKLGADRIEKPTDALDGGASRGTVGLYLGRLNGVHLGVTLAEKPKVLPYAQLFSYSPAPKAIEAVAGQK